MSTRAVLGGIRTLAAIAFATGIVLFGYVGIQQAHRTMANDPQIEIAEDAAAALRQGAAPAAVVPVRPVPLGTTRAVRDRRGSRHHPLATPADGRVPCRLCACARAAKRRHTVTRQPRPGRRRDRARGAGRRCRDAAPLREAEHHEQRPRVLGAF
jgi:hypothetical protein